ncbi:MAG: hypothetical protein M3380_18195, partial [Chloroflexota bacterium]|nr:hypothetical protein [Chloroflexota bacterium]
EGTPFSLADPEVTGEPLLAPVEPEAFEAPARASTDADTIEQSGSIEDQARTGAARERDTRSTAAREQPRPFSLADLGLTDEELAQLDTKPATDLSSEADGDWSLSGGETGDMRKPDETSSFSLADLGLSDEELELFGVLDDQAYAQPDTESSATEKPFSWMDAPVSGSQPAEATPPRHEAGTAPSWLANLQGASEPTAATPESPDPVQNSTATPELATDAISSGDEDASEGSVPSVPAELRHFHEQLAAQPDNHGMRLAVARMSEQKGEIEGAIEQYKQLIKRNALLEAVVEDLQEMVAGEYDRPLLRRIHRLLGDAYMKQNRMEEAMAEYSWA